MAEQKCLFIEALDAGNANDLRTVNSAFFGGRSFESISPGVGAVGRGHGILSTEAMKVTAQPTPNNTVNVAAGLAVVRGTQADSQGTYVCPLNADETVEIPPKDAEDDRTDYVVAQVRDEGFAAHTGDIWAVEVVQGTPGAGAPSIPHDCLVLAQVEVASGSGSTVISSSNITDWRPHARSAGGVTPVTTRSAFPSPMPYDVIWEISTSTLLMRLQGTWMSIGRNMDAAWQTYVPNFGGIIMGNGSKYGRFLELGRLIVGIAGFDLGTTGNIPAGLAITCTMPRACYNPGSNFRYMGAGRAFIGGNFYSCTAEINPSFDNDLMFNFATAGAPAWNATNPANWGNPGAGDGQLRVFYNFERA